MLLHDVGKGRGGGHVEKGARIAPRVVRAAAASTTRDAGGRRLPRRGAPRDVAGLAAARPDRGGARSPPSPSASGASSGSNMLLLLTYADHRAVGPGIWNEWKGTLLWELYNRHARAPRGPSPGRRRPTGHEAQAKAVGGAARVVPRGRRSSATSRSCPERYLRSTDAGRHGAPLPPGPRAAATAPVAFEWRDLADGHCTELTVVADDREGLFARLAGTLTANGVDILSVDLCSRGDGVVIDTFRLSEVSSPPAGARRAPGEGRGGRAARRSPGGSTSPPPSSSGALRQAPPGAARVGPRRPPARRCASTTRPRPRPRSSR